MNSIRADIKEVLELIASLDAQRAYQASVSGADVPAELVCMWFDDAYHPDSQGHKDAFSAQEQQLLSEFNTFYETRAPSAPTTLAELHNTLAWQEVVSAAQSVLVKILW